MKVFHTIAEMRADRPALGELALVPTMGALHAGHVSLIHAAKIRAPKTAVSIFVNPTQFGPREDFSNYPRPIEADLEKCATAGVDLVFNPSESDMYQADSPETVIDFPQLTSVLEGKHRQGHFRGVCQVVAKLFNIIQPQVACWAEEDFQQLRVLSAMTASLDWPIQVVACPTIRDPDGMAMSSRNQYLSAAERQQGWRQQAALVCRAGFGERRRSSGEPIGHAGAASVAAQHLSIDYIAAVDPLTLKPVEMITGPTVLAIAVRVGSTRLIDNVTVEPTE